MTKREALKQSSIQQSILIDALSGQADRDELVTALVIARQLYRKLQELSEEDCLEAEWIS